MICSRLLTACLALLGSAVLVIPALAGRVPLDPSMVVNEHDFGEPQGLVDEQSLTGTEDSPSGKPEKAWTVPSQHWKHHPDGVSAYLDLGYERYLASIWIFDTHGKGDLVIQSGTPGQWKPITTYGCDKYMTWVEVPLITKTRYLRLTRKDGGSGLTEIVLIEQTEEEFAAARAKAEAEARAAAEKAAAEARLAAEREAALAKARAEAANRPVIDLGEPFGKLTLIDEIDVAAADPGHQFTESPAGVSKVQNILGKPTRVLSKTPGEAAYIAFRIGKYKLLEPGGTYVLEVEYPEDAPRSMMILSSGNESSLGFHTGAAVGDAFHPKYVGNLIESIQTPLAGEHRTWRMLFNLHDRYPDLLYVRDQTGNRDLTPVDGFTVAIAQFSAENIPASHGAAVSRIRLFEVKDPSALKAQYRLPPEDLPRRHLFWREEMADGVLHAEKNGTPAGLDRPLDWYRFKANQMHFLAFNTYAKDLLEFGAVQHWDSTPHGGNRWAYFNFEHKDLWGQIVEMMGKEGFSILPYYEYAGSKGQQGLGPQRRAKPLTRDDGFTHIKWIESANADITDPETFEDFKKMLDLTIVRQQDKAAFVGAWLRPRSQLPMGFGDATRKRFAEEANNGQPVTRQQLQDDQQLYERYRQWWLGKRRDFLIACRDYLRESGIDDATIFYTAHPGEPGVPFPTWDPLMVTDDVEGWKQRLAATGYEKDAKIQPLSVREVVEKNLYLEALLAEARTWGGWEIHHATPAPDPANYKQTDGVLMTHGFNRVYTVASPATFDAFRGPAGLAIVRHYPLNENMMYDKDDQPKLGYFCADIERAGPYCMMAEALAMANGDPRYIGYLQGRVFARGFPQYVRNFNAAFLSLPALPSQRLDDASSDEAVVVRSIATPKHGTYLAVINTAMTDKTGVTITLPADGKLTDATTGEAIDAPGGKVQLTLYPFQMRALHIE